jgi:hypothetical protein
MAICNFFISSVKYDEDLLLIFKKSVPEGLFWLVGSKGKLFLAWGKKEAGPPCL